MKWVTTSWICSILRGQLLFKFAYLSLFYVQLVFVFSGVRYGSIFNYTLSESGKKLKNVNTFISHYPAHTEERWVILKENRLKRSVGGTGTPCKRACDVMPEQRGMYRCTLVSRDGGKRDR